MANAWLAHVKKTKQANPGMMFKNVLQLAGKSYKKQSGGSCGKALGNTHDGDAAEVADTAEGMGSREVVGGQPEQARQVNELMGGRRRKSGKKSAKKSAKSKKGGKSKKASKKASKSKKAGKKTKKNKKSCKSRK